jgi:putative ABC transport system substrate-binding protein
MRRVVAITIAIALGILVAPLAAEAQAAKVPRIGYLGTGSLSGASRLVEAFRQGLRDLGWVEGQNIAIEYRYAEGKFEKLPDLAGELVSLKVDLILAVATPGAGAAKQATRTIPVVMVGVGDPVGLGYVASLARPGGNIIGLSSMSVDLGPNGSSYSKRLSPGSLA